jgi:hypothetical protein
VVPVIGRPKDETGWEACAEASRTARRRRSFPAEDIILPKGRIQYIDCARGILFLLMTSTHALTLAQVSSHSLLQSGWWLPRGWATDSFIMLSGFTVATVFPWKDQRDTTRARLFRRAWHVLAVMFVSNIIMLLLQYALKNELAKVTQLPWWIGLVTLETEYTISGILLPTALFLLLLPWLFDFYHRHGPSLLIAAVLGCAFVAWGAWLAIGNMASRPHLLDVLFVTGAGGFPIVPLICLGALGFVGGLLWKGSAPAFRWCFFIGGVLALMGLGWLEIGSHAMGLDLLTLPFLKLARFVIILCVGLALTRSAALNAAFGFLPIIGKYALFSFILHRIVLQTLHLMNLRLLPESVAELVYGAYFAGTLGIITSLCILRDCCERVDRALRRLYL